MIEQMASDTPRFEPVHYGHDTDAESSFQVDTGSDADSIRGGIGRGARFVTVAAYHTFRLRYILLSAVGFAFGTAFTIYSATVGR